MVLVTPHLVKPMAQRTAQLPTDVYVEPNNVEFYLLGCTEGKRKKPELPEAPPGNVPAGNMPGANVPATVPTGTVPTDFGRQPVQ